MPDLETQGGGESLRETLEASFDSTSSEAETTVDTPAEPAESTETKAERARDEAGRFAKKQEEAALEKPTAEVQQAAVVPAATSPYKAPSSWKKEAAAVFDKIESGEPLTVQEMKILRDEALRREGDFHKGIESFKTHAEAGKAFEKVVTPYMETIRKFGVTPDVAVGELLKVDNLLRTAPPAVKAQKFMELARDYGIDLSQQFDPNVAELQARLYQMEEQQKQWQLQQQTQTHEALNSDIERFKAEAGHEHFEAVRDHMASLLQGGLAKDLQDAYDQAVYANPTTRASLLEQQRKEAEAQAQAQRARSAAVSVRGSSPASGASAPQVGSSIRDAVAAAFDAHS